MPQDTPDLRILSEREAPAAPPPARPLLGRVLGWLVGLGLIGGIVYMVWFWPPAEPAARTRPARPDSIPVLVATAERRDVPVWLDGLGTVQASATVTVKPMVDGQLMEVLFAEGQDVAEGTVLARIDARGFQAALDQARARKAMNEALLANARLDLARYTRLARENFASGQQADTARAMVAQLEAQVAQDQAQIDTASTNLSHTTITAPLSGRVGMRLMDRGNIARASDATGLVVIAALEPVAVLFTLPQQALEQVAQAMRAGTAPEVLALAQSAGITADARVLDRGQLAVLDNQVDPATGTIRMKALFANAERKLWPGGFVNVRLRAGTLRDVLTVPPAAIQRGPRNAFVYVVTEEDRVRRRAVSVGHEDQTVSVIETGLRPGERVVTDGAARLGENMKVSIATPEPARGTGVGRQAPGPPPGASPGAPPGAPGTRRGAGG